MENKETYTKEEVAKLLEWPIAKMGEYQQRYILTENFLFEYYDLPFWKRWFFGRDIILKHLSKMILNEK